MSYYEALPGLEGCTWAGGVELRKEGRGNKEGRKEEGIRKEEREGG